MPHQSCESSQLNPSRSTIRVEGVERNVHRTGASCGELMAALAFSAGRPAERLAGCVKKVITVKKSVLGRHCRPQRITCGRTITTREMWIVPVRRDYLIDSARSIVMRIKTSHQNIRENTNPDHTELVEALQRYQQRSVAKFGKAETSGHRRGASCGEPTAVLLFCGAGSEKSFAQSKRRWERLVGRHTEEIFS